MSKRTMQVMPKQRQTKVLKVMQKYYALMVRTMPDGVEETSQPFFLTLQDPEKDKEDEENAKKQHKEQPTARMIWLRLIRKHIESAPTWPTRLLMSADGMRDALDQMDDVENIEEAMDDIGDFMMNSKEEEEDAAPEEEEDAAPEEEDDAAPEEEEDEEQTAKTEYPLLPPKDTVYACYVEYREE